MKCPPLNDARTVLTNTCMYLELLSERPLLTDDMKIVEKAKANADAALAFLKQLAEDSRV